MRRPTQPVSPAPLFPVATPGHREVRGSQVRQSLLDTMRHCAPDRTVAYAHPQLRCQPGEIPKPVTYRVRSFITLSTSQLRWPVAQVCLHIALFRQGFYTASAMQGPALSRRCRALKVLSPSAWDVSIRAAVPSLVGNIAASVRSPHQYPCVHPSRRIPRRARPTTRRAGVDDAVSVSPFVPVAKAGPFPARLGVLVAQS